MTVSDETQLVLWTARPELCNVSRGVSRIVNCPLWRSFGTDCHVRRRTGREGVGWELVQRGVASFVMRSVMVSTMVCTRGVFLGVCRGVYTWCVHVTGY